MISEKTHFSVILSITKKFVATAMTIAAVFMLTMPLMAKAQNYDCTILGDTKRQADEKLIITVLEEQIGNMKDTETIGESTVIQCYRVSHGKFRRPTAEEGGCPQDNPACPEKWFWDKPEYASTCTPIQTATEIQTCQRIQAFISKTGTGVLFSYLGAIYRWAAGMIGIVTVFYLIWGGIMLSMAGDNTGQVDEAKQKIMQSIAGLVLLFLSALILYTVNPNFFTL